MLPAAALSSACPSLAFASNNYSRALFGSMAPCCLSALESNRLIPSAAITANMTPDACLATLLALVVLIHGCGNSGPDSQTSPKFRELSLVDSARLDQQRALVGPRQRDGTVSPNLLEPRPICRLLQRTIDDRAFSKAQTHELQSLGVAFGDVLSELPFGG